MAVLKNGSKGNDVLALQKKLNADNKGKVGYVPLKEDGIYGPKTDAANKMPLVRTAQSSPTKTAAEKKLESERYQWGNPTTGKLNSEYEAAILGGTEADYYKKLNETVVSPVAKAMEAANGGRTAQISQATYQAPAQTPTYQAPVAAAPAVVDNTDRYNAMFDEQARVQAAAIKAARDASISGYNSQIGDAPGMYNPLRNQSSMGGAVRAKGIKEAMAASGQGNSGANLTSQSANNAQTTGEIAGYNLQQTDLVNKLKTAIADVTSSASLQEVQSNAGINAQKIQAAIGEANRVSDTNYNRSQDAFGNNMALSNQQFNQGLASQQFGLQSQNQQFNQGMATQQQKLQSQQQNLDNLYRQQAFNYNKSRDTVQDSQWQKAMNLNLRQQSFSEAQQGIQNALSQNRISQEDAAQALQWAKFNADQDPNSFDNKLKTQQFDMNNQAKANTALNTVIDNYNKVYVTQSPDPSDPYGNNKITTINKKGILDSLKAATVSKSMTEAQAKQIASYYGISL
jgi:hypothetical protein